ncbi:hypothetical protein NQ318_020243 [Aromia moschata]|uniref:Uncharacterized protein n=1 Tax=Aromia moschata TaxID=1265417 RepID=A0AAV8ZAI2_9CUCU|nr:hypothetical protein NQ318_020243 [Aromia moschata]
MDWVISDELSITVGTVVGWIGAGAMIIGGCHPLHTPVQANQEDQGCRGFFTVSLFSTFDSEYFTDNVLSLIMNITMFLMIHLCVRVRNRNQLLQARQKIFTDFDAKFFWNWSDFQSYLDCMLVFTIATSLLMYIFIDYIVFVEIVGFLAVFTEAMLGTPQLVKNYRNKSTEGMSMSMVIMWTCGDVFKTIYFLLRSAPVQFWVCGSVQVSVDLLILLQTGDPRKPKADAGEGGGALSSSVNGRGAGGPLGSPKTGLSGAEAPADRTDNCRVVSADVHEAGEVAARVRSGEVSGDPKATVVDIVNSVRRHGAGCDAKKRASHVSYKERAKNKVSMLIHRHTL